MLSSEDYSKLLHLTDTILAKKNFSYFFSIPNENEEPAYRYLPNPICINLIKEKIIDKKYNTIDDFLNDFKTMKNNIILIHGSQSLTNILFSNLLTKVEKDIKNLRQNFTEKSYQSKFALEQLSKQETIEITNSINFENYPLNSILKQFHCKKNTFIKHISQYNLNLNESKRGRKEHKISEEDIQNVLNVRKFWKAGYKNISSTIDMPEWKTRKTLSIIIPPKQENDKNNNNQHLTRFHAKKVNYIWHTDIHYLKSENNETYYLIAFIDDCSRKILYYETGLFKDMSFTSEALKNCLDKIGVNNSPFELTTDNGKEFVGHEFEEALVNYKILHYRIRPRNPEENAKIERWWQHIKRLKSNSDIGIIVSLYNTTLQHSVLKTYINENPTPENAYNTIEKFDIDRDGIFNLIDDTP